MSSFRRLQTADCCLCVFRDALEEYILTMPIAQAVSCWLSTSTALVRAWTRARGFVMDIVAVSEYYDFMCQSFHQLLHAHHLSSGDGTIGQTESEVPSGVSLTPPQESIKKLGRVLQGFEFRHLQTSTKKILLLTRTSVLRKACSTAQSAICILKHFSC